MQVRQSARFSFKHTQTYLQGVFTETIRINRTKMPSKALQDLITEGFYEAANGNKENPFSLFV